MKRELLILGLMAAMNSAMTNAMENETEDKLYDLIMQKRQEEKEHAIRVAQAVGGAYRNEFWTPDLTLGPDPTPQKIEKGTKKAR